MILSDFMHSDNYLAADGHFSSEKCPTRHSEGANPRLVCAKLSETNRAHAIFPPNFIDKLQNYALTHKGIPFSLAICMPIMILTLYAMKRIAISLRLEYHLVA